MANQCKYAHAERLRTILWSKVAHARCVTDLQQTVRALEDLRVPKPVAASLRYWFGKIEQWAGPYVRKHITLVFNGNTMGEVSFSAVMKWVIVPDHFEQLFFVKFSTKQDPKTKPAWILWRVWLQMEEVSP